MTPPHLCRLALITDPHIDHARGPLRQHFPAKHYDAALVTGDISGASTIRRDLEVLGRVLDCPIFFVLGNHDYWGGSFASVASSLATPPPRTLWLRDAPPIELVPGVVLTGHDGWYDGRAGLPDSTPVILNDFFRVEDLAPYAHITPYAQAGLLGYRMVDRTDLLLKLREIGGRWADEARAKLEEAVALKPKRVLFATHVPPFPGACWHEGKVSNAHWQPWFVNVMLGHVLTSIAEENRDISFEVFCGHTHSPGVYQHADNLVVRTGESVYGAPRVYDTLTLTA